MVKRDKAPVLSINEILERVGEVTRRRSNSGIAADLGSTPTTVSNWKARNTIPWEALYSFAHKNKVAFEWLLSGLGPMSSDECAEPGSGAPSKDEIARYRRMIERYEWIIDNLRNESHQ